MFTRRPAMTSRPYCSSIPTNNLNKLHNQKVDQLNVPNVGKSKNESPLISLFAWNSSIVCIVWRMTVENVSIEVTLSYSCNKINRYVFCHKTKVKIDFVAVYLLDIFAWNIKMYCVSWIITTNSATIYDKNCCATTGNNSQQILQQI